MKSIILLLAVSLVSHADIETLRDKSETPFLVHIGNCAGVVLSPRIVATAAHCIFNKKKKLARSWVNIQQNPNHLHTSNKHRSGQLMAFKYKSKGLFIFGLEPVMTEDWAVFYTSKRFDLDEYPPILDYDDIKDVKEDEVVAYGYPQYTNYSRAKVTNATVAKVNKGIIKLKKETVIAPVKHKGFSGGPTIVMEGRYTGYFIGVNSGFAVSPKKFRISYSREFYEVLKTMIEMDYDNATHEEFLEIQERYYDEYFSRNKEK